MERILEDELMDNEEQAKAYALADFSQPHNLFVELFQEKFKDINSSFNDVVLDLGCGPCDVTRRFAHIYKDSGFHAVDGAQAMIAQAKTLNTAAGLSHRIKLINENLPLEKFPQSLYHVIISNSLLHHLHDPFVLWKTIQDNTKAYAHVFVMDLIRPTDEQTVQFLVNEYAKDEAEILKNDFKNSLRAAFTVKEVKKQLDEMGLYNLQVEEVSDRHMIMYGVL